MSDYYLQDKSRLQGKPKATLADYVEQQGLFVPRRFASLQDARKSGLPFLGRSEHPQEYAGASGVLESYSQKDLQQISSEQQLVDKCEEIRQGGLNNIAQYCALTNTSEQDFRKDISYSFWELLPGYNRVIVADTAIPQRYHIMTKDSNSFMNYTIVEQGKITSDLIYPLPQELKDNLPSVIEMYETIRNLSHFNSNHCPIMEIQTVGEKNYFLQYHRTRDTKQTTFVLDQQPTSNQQKALFVRGATTPQGLTVDVTLVYAMLESLPYEYKEKGFSNFKLPSTEEASFDQHYYRLFAELMLPKRKVQINHNSVDGECADAVNGHNTRSKLFKPEVSLTYWPPLFTSQERKYFREKALQTGKDQKIKVHVISDGTTAYVQRV